MHRQHRWKILTCRACNFSYQNVCWNLLLPDLCSRGTRFESWTGDKISWSTSLFSSVPAIKSFPYVSQFLFDNHATEPFSFVFIRQAYNESDISIFLLHSLSVPCLHDFIIQNHHVIWCHTTNTVHKASSNKNNQYKNNSGLQKWCMN